MISMYKLTGKILLLSGLHIGGSDAGIKIGGIDTPVIKNSFTGLPYIPGSSLKGKLRFLLEHYYGVVDRNGDVSKATFNGQRNEIGIVFGHLEHDKINFTSYPTRLICRDANVIGGIEGFDAMEEEELLKNALSVKEAKEKMNSLFVEGKTEVSIDRLTGTVKQRGGGLRQVERVPAGTLFDFEVVMRVFIPEEKEMHLKILLEGLKLLENDALGGYGSRGSGRIKFLDLKQDGEKIDLSKIVLK